jgi:hypothetical protein
MKLTRPWMLANLKIIWQFRAHPVHQKVSRVFGPRYIGDDFFLMLDTSAPNGDFTFYESICFNNGRIAVFGECVKERTLYRLRLHFYLLVLCVYTFLLIWITKQRNGLLTTLLIVILLKRLFYNTRFKLFSIGCKYVFMPLTELTQHGNDELLTTTYIWS